MKRLFSIVSVIAASLSISCSNTAFTYEYNTSIDPKITSEIKSVEESFLKSIKEKRYNDTNLFLSESLHDNLHGIDQFYNMVNPILIKSQPSTRDDYYIKSISIKGSSSNLILIDSDKIKSNFKFKFDPIEPQSNKMFISLQKYTTPEIDYLLGFIYAYEDNSWKVNTFRLGVISVNNLDAVNWMDIALNHFHNNEVINSYFCAEISNLLSKPFPLVHYEKDTQMQTSYDRIKKRVIDEYNLPFKINSISTRPELFDTKIIIEGFGPMPVIKYKSNISLTKVTLLKKEANELATYLKKHNPNLKKNFPLIVFQAYNKIPLPTDISNEFYGLPVEL